MWLHLTWWWWWWWWYTMHIHRSWWKCRVKHMNLPEWVREGCVRNFVLLDEHILHTLAFGLTLDLVIANSCIQQSLWNLSPMRPIDWPSPFFLPVQIWRIPTPTILDLLTHWSYLLFTVPHPLSPSFPILLHAKQFKHSLHCISIAALFSFGKNPTSWLNQTFYVLQVSPMSGIRLEWKHNRKDGLTLYPWSHPHCF